MSAGGKAAVQIETYDRAEIAHLPCCERMLRMLGQAWVVHARNLRPRSQKLRDAHGACALRRVADEVGLQAALDQKRRVRIQRAAQGAEIRAQQPHEFRT